MDAIAAYQDSSIAMQSKERLVVLLYEGAVRFLKQAIEATERNDLSGKAYYLSKATDIILELNASLNMEVGGEIAQNLRRLYDFMYNHLMEASTRKDSGRVWKVIELLEELNRGWKAAANSFD